jgi:hypothetical protein
VAIGIAGVGVVVGVGVGVGVTVGVGVGVMVGVGVGVMVGVGVGVGVVGVYFGVHLHLAFRPSKQTNNKKKNIMMTWLIKNKLDRQKGAE